MTRNRLSHLVAKLAVGLMAFLVCGPLVASPQNEAANKALARRFYEQVWFSNNPAAVDELVAPEYVLHDVGELKAVREPASEQKAIADFFWQNGTMSGSIDYQIAEGDLVATRWQWRYEPTAWWMKGLMLGGQDPIPIINVFRFENGKIVEIWNHRHDIDIGFRANALLVQGFIAAVVLVAILALGRRLWRRVRRGAGAA